MSRPEKLHLSWQNIKDLGATPGLIFHRVGADRRAGQGRFGIEAMFHRPDLSSLRSAQASIYQSFSWWE